MEQEKPDITYPCQWSYRIIGTHEAPIKNSVEALVTDKKYKLVSSNTSSSGKYVSMALSLIVDTEEERLSLFNALKANDEIKMVL